MVLDFPIRERANVDGEYEGFITELRETLANHPERENYIAQYGPWLRDHPLLPVQPPIQPARWIHINLIVQDEDGVEETRITIAVRDDNVYLKGFKNGHDKWYELGFEGRSVRFIAGSTFLRRDVGYTDLVGGSANLVSLSLTKYDVIRAVRRLSVYEQMGPADGETVGHLARLCVIICECARMIPHRDTVRVRWNSNDQTGITPQQAENIKDWSKMSRELLSDPNPEGNSYLDVVHLLLNTPVNRSLQQDQQEQTAGGGGSSQQGPGKSNPQKPSSGRPTSSSGGSRSQQQKGQTGGKPVHTRPLVEVFYVEADFRVSTIAVFDGKRGQIIYKHGHQSRSQDFDWTKLALTGPYRAISADGSFAIQVYGITSGTDNSNESREVIGEMVWDCYAKDDVYNKVLTRDVFNTDTGDHLAEVAYTVWSEAVEATVEVNLLVPGLTRIHGTIRAQCKEFTGQEVVLFSRERYEQVDLVPSSAKSMVPLELRRSMIAVPINEGLVHHMSIDVELHAFIGNVYYVHLQGYIHFFLDKHTGEIRVEQSGDITVPGGWTSDGSRGTAGSVQVNITSPGFHRSPPKPASDHHKMVPLQSYDKEY